MNGILCIDKPPGFTSFDVVAKVRGISKTRKIGHGGTLDPMATGVLPLFLGGATKACDRLPNQDKRYTATFRLGIITDTLDITGQVLEQHPVKVSAAQVEAAVHSFRGKGSQLPPMYSAVQVNGVRLYDLARQGVEVERKPRDVEIYSIDLLHINEQEAEYTIDAHCSKGTYIRSLCHDVGELLGCGATLTALRRTLSCGFTLEQCVTLEEAQALADEGTLSSRLLALETAFADLPTLHLTTSQATRLQNGIRLEAGKLPEAPEEAMLSVYGPGRQFLGLAIIRQGRLQVEKLFVREAIK